jgi:hypothetical protein
MRISFGAMHLSSASSRSLCITCLLPLVFAAGCKKYLTIPLPADEIAGSGAFASNNAASGVLTGIYGSMSSGSTLQGSGGIGYFAGLYTDEQQNASVTGITNQAFYTDALSSSIVGGGIWTPMYQQLYTTNLAIEGLTPTQITQLTMRNQLLGEAYFLRAFLHFYLTNVYGTVPIQTTSDYATNDQLARSPQAAVYQQIVSDLKQALTLLDDNYRDENGAITTDRARPNKMAAMALLARVYLYTGDWPDAESQADSLIGNTAIYQLTPPAQTFLTGSQETIWGLAPPAPFYDVADAAAYIITPGMTPQASGVSVNLSNTLVSAFEAGDTRFSNWVGVSNVPASGTQPAATYYYAYKYKTKTTQTAPAEYLSVLRLGEVYLIRAEARAEQGNISATGGAADDLNAVRARAGLAPTTAATQADMLTAILHERQVELFSEGGHRLFDLRRTGQLNTVMGVQAPLKDGSWQSYMEWWPIPLSDIQADPNLTQTPGFE